jgi:hypothetical protein
MCLTTTPAVHDLDDELAFGTPPKGRPDDTLVIVDWDDTLLCSSAINQCSQLQLDVLCRTAEAMLRAAMELGEVMIVSNGVDRWVEDSCRRFLPGLLPLLGELSVKSARHDYERVYPGDPFAWKREAFRDILQPRPKATNLVVLGDSLSEIRAAHGALSCMAGSSLVKTVKFKEAPSANQLIGQLRRVSQEMSSLVSQDSHKHSNLERCPAQLGHMAGWASGWRLSHDSDADRSIGGLIPDAGNAGTDFSKGRGGRRARLSVGDVQEHAKQEGVECRFGLHQQVKQLHTFSERPAGTAGAMRPESAAVPLGQRRAGVPVSCMAGLLRVL